MRLILHGPRPNVNLFLKFMSFSAMTIVQENSSRLSWSECCDLQVNFLITDVFLVPLRTSRLHQRSCLRLDIHKAVSPAFSASLSY